MLVLQCYQKNKESLKVSGFGGLKIAVFNMAIVSDQVGNAFK